MRKKVLYLLSFAIAVLFFNVTTGFTQEAEQTTPPVVEEPKAPEPVVEPEMQWLWGEVSSVGIENKEITVKYLDYETDTEKEIKINVDDRTSYDNAASLDSLKPKDTISVDYIIAADGKNIAKIISLEKIEETPVAPKEEAPSVLKEETPAMAPVTE